MYGWSYTPISNNIKKKKTPAWYCVAPSHSAKTAVTSLDMNRGTLKASCPISSLLTHCSVPSQHCLDGDLWKIGNQDKALDSSSCNWTLMLRLNGVYVEGSGPSSGLTSTSVKGPRFFFLKKLSIIIWIWSSAEKNDWFSWLPESPRTTMSGTQKPQLVVKDWYSANKHPWCGQRA